MDRAILLVDDEPGLRRVLGLSLEDIGYRVYQAESVNQALEIFDRHQPPLVLTDIKMPGRSGLALLQEIKARSPETEVIMITGHGDMDLAVQSLQRDACDFITKPITDEALEIALKRAWERIHLRRQVREYTQNLERLVEEKSARLIEAQRLAAVGETVAGLSHAIKNIASGLEGSAFVVEKGLELGRDEYLRQGWDLVRSNVEKIKNLSLDLLRFTKPVEVHPAPGAPNDPAREVYQLMGPRAAEMGLILEFRPDESLKEFCLDPDIIHACLLNLVTNALEACRESASPEETGKVVILTRPAPEGGIEYRVEDNGPGLDRETRPKVLTRFFTTKGSAGNGLGLMMTKRMIEAHGGLVGFDTEKEVGAAFYLVLPESEPTRQ